MHGQWHRQAGRSWVRWFVLGTLLMALGGCLQQASDKDFDFDNDNDPTDTTTDVEDVQIIYVDDADSVVTIANFTSGNTDLTSWTLKNEDTAATFTFSALTLAEPGLVYVHQAAGIDDGQNLYSSGVSWATGDTATLRDSAGGFVDSCAKGNDCWP